MEGYLAHPRYGKGRVSTVLSDMTDFVDSLLESLPSLRSIRGGLEKMRETGRQEGEEIGIVM